MPDSVVSATAFESSSSLFAAVTTDLVRDAQRRHGLSPTATAALGRLLAAAAIFGAGLARGERISLQLSGDGPLRGAVSEAWLIDDATIGVRGYARVPDVDLPLNAAEKFDVAGAVGDGVLQVTKSFEIGQPYTSVVPLRSGEIAEDVAAYLADSEQIPSVVALGVLANPSGVIAAGGAMAHLLPGAAESAIAQLERGAAAMPAVTASIFDGADALDLARGLAGDGPLRAQRRFNVRFTCRCTRAKVEAALIALGADELRKMARERELTQATCEFCRRVYELRAQEVSALVNRLERA